MLDSVRAEELRELSTDRTVQQLRSNERNVIFRHFAGGIS